MKVRIKNIRAAGRLHLDASLNPTPWPGMVLELLVEEPQNSAEAAAQLKQAQEWASPAQPVGALVCAPPALDLTRPDLLVDVPDFEWPSCQGCEMGVEVHSIGDGCLVGELFSVRCPACGQQATALTPLEALRKYNRGEFAE